MFSVYCLPIRAILILSLFGWTTAQRNGVGEDPRGVQIIKQINRVNEDGTYTYGYEAADGSFKIETRDVLGNVKGMFGYVDANGELKRVSYSAANGTGFQASEDYENIPPSEMPTRRPFLLYRGSSAAGHQIQKIPPRRRVSTSPAYEFGTRRSQVDFNGGEAEPSSPRSPVRILVTKRPLGSVLVDPSQEDVERNNNLISRRQLESRDNQDVYSSGRGSPRRIPDAARESRYDPAAERPYQREVYRNLLLEQNNLKPDYIPPVNRGRYYPSPAEEQDEDYPDVPAVVPMVNRVLGSPLLGDRRPPSTRFARPPPSIIDENAYPVAAPPVLGRRPSFRGLAGPRGYPPVPYSPQIDYESLREEIMNYLIQYIQYRTRGYVPGYGNYQEPIGTGNYYQPRPPLYQQDLYNQQRFYPGRFGGGALPSPVQPQAAPPVGAPRPIPGFGLGQSPAIPQYADYAQPGPIPPGGVYGRPPFIPGGYNQPAGPAASYPYVNPNVQYSESQDASGPTTTASSPTSNQDTQTSETLNAFKTRMDASDHHDASDTRPPAPGLIRMLLARPGTPRTQLTRPSIRSVEILGTAATENRPMQTSTSTQSSETTQKSVLPISSTTADPDPMIASA